MNKSRLFAAAAVAVLALAAATAPTAVAAPAAQPAAPAAIAPAPLSTLVKDVNIPFEQFTLKNGLRVIVHTDRKTPVVATSVWYGVGSGHEPKGRTGFAHLFEHLMFNGSGNYDGEFFLPLEEVGSTNENGTTWLDRTNYFQNVPTPALELALFLEADRMGNLLPAVTQDKLDNQRGVVQNEKRLSDNQPYGLANYAIQGTLFPEGHPYHHSTIGSMADLDAASLDDVRAWFKQYYGPNNAVLVLAGDIDAKTARPLVEKYFGAIPRGPEVKRPAGGIPERTTDTRVELKDRVPTTRITMTWATPGLLKKDSVLLDVATTVLADGSSSRLHNALVRDEQLAVSVSGRSLDFVQANMISISVDVKPGVDAAKAEARARELITKFLAEGPTADEVTRAATRTTAANIRGLEQIGGFGGKAVTLAEGALYAGDSAFYKKQLSWYAGAKPADVQKAAQAWLSKGAVVVVTAPGERGEKELALAGVASQRPAPEQKGETAAPDRSKLPKVNPETTLVFPAIERATLSNGVKVTFARRAAIPTVSISAVFDAGSAADTKDKTGLQRLTLNAMREGAGGRTGRQISEELERLGANLATGFGADTTQITLSALKPNLAASVGLMADIMRTPAFDTKEVERLRAIQLSAIAQEENTPNGIAQRALRPLLYGADHPYGLVSALGVRETVAGYTRADLAGFHAKWIRPDNMQIFVVGDTTLAEITPVLERAFGSWTAPAGVAKGAKTFTAPAPQAQGKVLLIDRPNSPQSVIVAAAPVGVKGRDNPITLDLANYTLGGSFTSRINYDLRETKGWSYGAGSGVSIQSREDVAYTVNAPVQADRTGDSILAIKQQITDFVGPKPVTSEELSRAIASSTLSLPGTFETAGSVLTALLGNANLGRPDDYWTTYPTRLRALGQADVTAEAKARLNPDQLIWVVVGDAKVVEPQLAKIGMPVEVRRAAPK
ncbi:MAG: insulinase family protein [Alphaproteobacteria bacterium]|nr:insulinase family protein [Alphaproteobacteria bacterium]